MKKLADHPFPHCQYPPLNPHHPHPHLSDHPDRHRSSDHLHPNPILVHPLNLNLPLNNRANQR